MKLIILAVVIFLAGCTTQNNTRPEILRAVSDLAINQGDTLQLSLELVSVRDRDGDTVSLHAMEGDNYILEGMNLIPDAGFHGTLRIPLQVNDGIDNSPVFTLRVQVLRIHSVIPLTEGNTWLYRDRYPDGGKTVESRLTIRTETETDTFSGRTFQAVWDNLDTLEIGFTFGDVPGQGSWLLGATSPYDTLSRGMLRFAYPVDSGESWDAYSIAYNISDTQFIANSGRMTCQKSRTYTTVPAGTFSCVSYVLRDTLVPIEGQRRIGPGGLEGISSSERNDPVVQERTYMVSPGIGLISLTVRENGEIHKVKELLEYLVE
ncbi:MAG: hypothetical protein ACQEQV_05120 [Fibrobacterota bacterium]